MSIQDQIASLEELSALDQEIRAIDEELNRDRSAINALKAELAKLEASIATDTATINDMAKTRQELVQEVRQVTTQLEHSREKLARTRNEREANAATRELEELRRIQKDREEEAGKLQVLEAQAQKTKDEAEAKRAEILQKLNSNEGATVQRLNAIEAQKNSKLEIRANIIKNLPRNILSRYDMIRQRRGVGIAITQDGTCQACHMALAPQLFQRILRNERLEQCPSCQRILFYKPPVASEEKH